MLNSNLIVCNLTKVRADFVLLQIGLALSRRDQSPEMTTAMAAHQDSIHERLQGPEEPLYLHHAATWNTDAPDHQEEHSAEIGRAHV